MGQSRQAVSNRQLAMPPQLDDLLQAASAAYDDADIFAYFGIVGRPFDDEIITLCRERKVRKNVIFMLTTLGGNVHAAYRITRCFQRKYKIDAEKDEEKGKFYVFVDSLCGSAGTLVALGDTDLIVSDHGELGPIDVQLRKPEEVGERRSGLTLRQALLSLERESRRLVKSHFRQLRFDSDLGLNTKTAVEISSNITIGLLSSIYGQIDPMQMGEVERALEIAVKYGERVGKINIKEDALEKLLGGYPSHEFVIDRREARTLFKNVDRPKPELEAFGEFIRPMAEDQLTERTPFKAFLIDPPADSGKSDDQGEANGGGRNSGKNRKGVRRKKSTARRGGRKSAR